MRSLVRTIVLAGGRGRAVLVVATTALTAALLLIAASIVLLWAAGEEIYEDRLLMPIVDEGTRPGAVLAVLLTTVPVLLLMNQAVRLGSPDQHRRYSALAIAGATRSDLRRWAAIEVGGPALLGAVLGVPVWLALRQVLGYGLREHTGALVPMSVGPGFLAPVVVAAVAAYGAVVGWRSAGAATRSTERGVVRRPRPWPLALIGAGAAVLTGRLGVGLDNLAVSLGAIVLVLAGAVLSAPWAAHRAGRFTARRARSAALLLAGRRLEAEPWAAGRAAAAVGAVGLVMGVLGVFVADLYVAQDDYGDLTEYLVPAAVVAVIALLAVLMIAGSVAVHSVETTLERRREMAALVATGVPVSTVSAALRAECLLVTLPLTIAFSSIGALGSAVLTPTAQGAQIGGVIAFGATVATVALAVTAVVRAVRPWLDAAVEPRNLRTE